MGKKGGKLIVALDVDTFDAARSLVDSLSPVVDIFKVGSQLFTACGPAAVRYVLAHNRKVFLDLKFHDIPNTVASAMRAVVGLGKTVHDIMNGKGAKVQSEQGIFMCSLHTTGGEEMLKTSVYEATKQAEIHKVTKPLIVGITVLTSEEKRDNIQQIVLQRARLAKECGLDGVVASSEEAKVLRKEFGEKFIIVTPGIRPKGSKAGDQKRITTPRDAVLNGSDYLVVGRPIVAASDPFHAAKEMLKEIE